MFKFWLPAVWPWISHFFPLNLSFHPCVMAVNTLCWGSANVHILPPPIPALWQEVENMGGFGCEESMEKLGVLCP